MNTNSCYICIDLKCFYASVECVERNLDPFKTNLVVADKSRGNGALCLAISPALKKLNVKNRCRLFEIPDNISYIIARPRMSLYMQYSADIYEIYLKYIASEDIHVYSIDEAFIYVTPYLKLYNTSAYNLAKKILNDIFDKTGICATCGIGDNMYLAKVAMDIVAKHNNTHMGILTVEEYQKQLWHHQPLTDFWQIGNGIMNRLAKYGLHDMYDIAHFDEKTLYKEFGINARYLIDHARGIEPITIKDIKKYQSHSKSISNSQILFTDYSYEDAMLILCEMVENNVLSLTRNHLVTDNISLYIGYSKDIIKATGGSFKITTNTNCYSVLVNEFLNLYQRTTKHFPIRRIAISFNNVKDEMYESYDLFSNIEALEKEKQVQQVLIDIKDKFGKNAVIKGMNLLDKATQIDRNRLIGGHNAY